MALKIGPLDGARNEPFPLGVVGLLSGSYCGSDLIDVMNMQAFSKDSSRGLTVVTFLKGTSHHRFSRRRGGGAGMCMHFYYFIEFVCGFLPHLPANLTKILPISMTED